MCRKQDTEAQISGENFTRNSQAMSSKAILCLLLDEDGMSWLYLGSLPALALPLLLLLPSARLDEFGL